MPPRPPRAPHRLFRALMRLFPFDFRAEFEPEMEAVFDEQRRGAPTRRLRLRLWGRTLADALRAAPREHLDILCQDSRYAVRVLRSSPGFTFTAVFTLALGIGANTAVFGLVRAVLLRPLPYHEPDRLVSVASGRTRTDNGAVVRGILTGKDVMAFRERATTIQNLAIVHEYSPELSSPVDLIQPDGAERLRGGLVSSNFFETLGVSAAIGRLFGSGGHDADRLAVISDGYWRRKFGADPRIVGRRIDLLLVGRRQATPERYTVVGVLPPRFRFTYPRETEVWAMLPWDAVRPTGALEWEVTARLRPGVTAEQSAAELTAIRKQLWPGRTPSTATVTPLPDLASGGTRPGVLLLAAVAAVVLLLASVNVVLLLMARVADRASEVAVRAALGAGWFRLGRQLLVEASVLISAGGAVGVGLAWAIQPALRALIPSAVTRGDETSLDLTVLAFAAALCIGLTVIAGVAPLWHVSAHSVQQRLQLAGNRAAGDRGITFWRRGVMALQAGVVLVLLVGATLLLHSVWRMRHVDLGYDGAGLLTMEINTIGRTVSRSEWARVQREFDRELLERVRALPGVEQVSVTTSVPLRGVDFTWVVGPVGGRPIAAHMRAVDVGFFDVMRIPTLAGRSFNEHDTADSLPVAVVSRDYARQLFGDQNPLGRQLDLGETRPVIVGVVADVKHLDVRVQAEPAFYLPRDQQPNPVACLVVRTRANHSATAAEIRQVVRDLDPTQPVERITTVSAIVDETIASDRFYAVATGAFGGIALLLAVSGLIGVVRRGVVERTRELAIRNALGANAGRLVRETVLQELRPVLLGTGLGLIGAFWLSRLLQRFLFEVSPLDPWAYGAASLLLLTTAFAGCYLPARSIARIDPATALRAE